ncbi:hypothetical protein TruAng_011131 [Truncatella angustata]|nr:hypothetical protein TruAng_011131 [Truncatella angustata]
MSVSVIQYLNTRKLLESIMVQALGSSYLLGASTQKLKQIYNAEAEELKQVHDVFIQGGITRDNWRDFLGQKQYTVAYTNFFDIEVQNYAGDWNAVVDTYLFAGSKPLINGFSGGLGHPFIHLAYAYEFNSSVVATEALSMGCTEYDDIHRFIDRYPDDNSTYQTASLEKVLNMVRDDRRFDDMFDQPGFANVFTTLEQRETIVLEHWNGWIVTDPYEQLDDCMFTASRLAIETSNSKGEFDFYLAHVLTVGHALRILLPLMPVVWHIPVMKQYGLFTILVYIAQLRPAFDAQNIESWELKASNWSKISEDAVNNELSVDIHFPKVVRALKVAEEAWGSKHRHFMKAAEKFIAEFKRWTGFGLGVDVIP